MQLIICRKQRVSERDFTGFIAGHALFFYDFIPFLGGYYGGKNGISASTGRRATV